MRLIDLSEVFALKKQLLCYYVDVSPVRGLVTFDIILIQRMKKIKILHIAYNYLIYEYLGLCGKVGVISNY